MKYKLVSLLLVTGFTASTMAFADGHGHAETSPEKQLGKASLETVLDAQTDDAKARFQYRNPKATLEFFDIKPGMTVMEALPGGGWYTKILLPYLGSEGKVIGADYALDMWPKFGFFSDEAIAKKKTWVEDWTAKASEWRNDHSADVAAFQFNAMAADMKGTADAALFIRATHNLARFDNDGEYLTKALKETFDILKPGGTVGVVQHQAREDRPDSWADGSSGYLKKSYVIDRFQAAGFEFVGEAAINENAKDQAGEGDIVWRLPPTLNGVGDDEDKRTAMLDIGESHRMTLKFQKPE